jgi:hypothetical protein
MSPSRLSSFVAALLLSSSLAPFAAAAPPAYLRTIGAGQLGTALGVAIGSDGDVFVLDGNDVSRFHPDGTFVSRWDPSVGLILPYQNAQGIESDRNGSIFVSTRGGGYPAHVREFDESGGLIADYTGNGPGENLGDSWGMGYSNGRLFITDGRLWRLQLGQLTLLPNLEGCGPGELWNATSVAVIGNNLYETEYSERLQRLTIGGAFVAELGSVAGCGQIRGYPRFVAPDGAGAVVVVDMLTNFAQIVTTDGVVLATWGGTGSAHGQFSAAGPAAVGSDGLIYITDVGNNRVEVYSPGPTPTQRSSWGQVKTVYR